jgi:protease-4
MHFVYKITFTLVAAAILGVATFYVGLTLYGTWHDEWSGYNASLYIGDGYCNIAVIPIQGDILSYGELYDEFGNLLVSTNIRDTLSVLEFAGYEPGIEGVLFLIDSSGGSPAAGHLIASAIKNSPLPNAAYVADSANSAAYLIATGADTIIASPYADVGSIGITMSHLNYAAQNEAQGIEYISLSSGKFKDYVNPEKPMTDEERALLERDLQIWHEEFVSNVAEYRDIPREDVARLADGSSLPAQLALEAGLIDTLGDLETVRSWFAAEMGLAPQDIMFCQLP